MLSGYIDIMFIIERSTAAIPNQFDHPRGIDPDTHPYQGCGPPGK